MREMNYLKNLLEPVHKKYSERPKSLKDMCLAQFATSYRSVNAVPEDIDWKDGASIKEGSMLKFGSNEPLPKFIKLSSGGYMVLRIRPIVLRIHSSKKKEAHEGIYSELLLYLPWRKESELHEDNFINCEKHFKDHEHIIKQNKEAIFPNSPMIDTMMELLETNDALKPTHLSEDIDPVAQQENIEDQYKIVMPSNW